MLTINVPEIAHSVMILLDISCITLPNYEKNNDESFVEDDDGESDYCDDKYDARC